MIIDIRDIPVYYINMESKKERKENIEAMLKDAGFKNILRFNAYAHSQANIGCAISHKAILDQIIKDNVQVPFLVLEDDAAIFDSFNPLISVPDDSDAVYLGLTTSARMWNYTVLDMVAKPIDDQTYRIYNLLAAHAVLYTSIDYVKFLSKAIQTAIDVNGHQDIVRASTMKFFNVYAKDNPVFFQNDHTHRNDLQTSVPLNKMKIVSPNASSLGFTCNCQIHR